MKTIKVIDLIIKLANEEELPKKIKIRGYNFKLSDNYKDYNINYAYEDAFDNCWLDMAGINEEVEIIEEDKEIEPLDVYTNAYITNEMSSFYEHNFESTVKHNFEVINKRINEIIIAVNSIKKGN